MPNCFQLTRGRYAPSDDGQWRINMQITFTKAIVEFFGKKPNQSTTEFMQELKALDEKDREYFRREFTKIGYEIIN
jgi:hypothetical protein